MKSTPKETHDEFWTQNAPELKLVLQGNYLVLVLHRAPCFRWSGRMKIYIYRLRKDKYAKLTPEELDIML